MSLKMRQWISRTFLVTPRVYFWAKFSRHHFHTLTLDGELFLAPISDDIQASWHETR